MMRRTRGFTIIELLIVITIIGILSLISVVSFSHFQAEGRDNQRAQQAAVIAEALEKYYSNNGEYPGCSQLTGTTQAAVTTLTQTTLPGLSPTALVTPQAPSGTLNSITCSQTPDSSHDVLYYQGDGTTACNTGTSCLQFTLSYYSEGTAQTVAVASRNTTPASLVAQWRFDGNTFDSSGNGNTGTPTNLTATTDKNGNANSAYSFDGSTSFVGIADAPTLDPSTLTMTAWVYITAYNSNGSGVLAKLNQGSTISNPPYELRILPSGQPMIGMQDSTNTAHTATCSSTASLNTWYFLTGTVTGSSVNIYLNGTLCGTTATTASPAVIPTLLYIGQQKPGNSRFFSGTIDDVRLYSGVLTSAGIASLYSLGPQ